jgi:sugar O-acyltransferase (sialic acid O-acetyltransferase NeuD family)
MLSRPPLLCAPADGAFPTGTRSEDADMADAIPVTIPLINPNEPEARLAHVAVRTGQKVERGQTLATLETTKATQEVMAEQAGFVVGLRARPGDSLRAGDVLCWIASTKDWVPPPMPSEAMPATAAVEGLRITLPARRAAEQAGIDLRTLPADRLVTEGMVRALIAVESAGELPDGPFDELAIVVYGGGGHGKSLIELIRTTAQYAVAGVIDDNQAPGTSVLGAAVLGGRGALPELRRRGLRLAANAIGGIGDARSRIAVFETLSEAGFHCPPLIHPTAWLETTVDVGDGVQILPHAYVGSDVRLGLGVIVNTSAVVSHDCRLGDYANIAPGALLAGGVQVGSAALIGMGVTIHLGVRIGEGARCGNSSVITADVPDGTVVRAGSTWPERKAV